MDKQAEIDKLRQARWRLALIIRRMEDESDAVCSSTGHGIALLDHYANCLSLILYDLTHLLPDEYESGDTLRILTDGCPNL